MSHDSDRIDVLSLLMANAMNSISNRTRTKNAPEVFQETHNELPPTLEELIAARDELDKKIFNLWIQQFNPDTEEFVRQVHQQKDIPIENTEYDGTSFSSFFIDDFVAEHYIDPTMVLFKRGRAFDQDRK